MNKIICECLNISEQDIKNAIQNGASTFEEVQKATGICTGCGSCLNEAEKAINNFLHKERK